jgi:hypothetical protein
MYCPILKLLKAHTVFLLSTCIGVVNQAVSLGIITGEVLCHNHFIVVSNSIRYIVRWFVVLAVCWAVT